MQVASENPKAVKITDLRHVTIAYSRDTYRGHPRTGGIHNFGNGELAVIYNRSPCSYEKYNEVYHDFYSLEHSKQVLTRTFDNGETWPREEEAIVWERGGAVSELRERLWPGDTDREEMDMTQPGACFYFGRSWAGKMVQDVRGYVPLHISFSLRSVDKGKTWEKTPTLFAPPVQDGSVISYGNQPIKLADNSFLVVLTAGKGADPQANKKPVLYISEDNGLSWEFISTIVRETSWDYTYPDLIMLPGGRIQCYMMRQKVNYAVGNWMCMNYSDDGGLSWSPVEPIGRLGFSPWVARRRAGEYSRPKIIRDPAGRIIENYEPKTSGTYYGHAICRSPSPLLLKDGRILVLYSRRKPPFGIGGMVSEDQGITWSREFIVREGASSADIGYQVATELEDGRIFTVYYFTLEDGNKLGGTRFIAGSYFRIH